MKKYTFGVVLIVLFNIIAVLFILSIVAPPLFYSFLREISGLWEKSSKSILGAPELGNIITAFSFTFMFTVIAFNSGYKNHSRGIFRNRFLWILAALFMIGFIFLLYAARTCRYEACMGVFIYGAFLGIALYILVASLLSLSLGVYLAREKHKIVFIFLGAMFLLLVGSLYVGVTCGFTQHVRDSCFYDLANYYGRTEMCQSILNAQIKSLCINNFVDK